MAKLFDVGFVDRLSEKFFGKGKQFYMPYYSQFSASDGAQKIASTSVDSKGRKVITYERKGVGGEGLISVLRDALYTQTKSYIDIMQELAESIYASYGIEPAYPSENPIPDNFFREMRSGGEIITAVFGNHSDHARYVEWGTGPVGSENRGNITDTQWEMGGPINYRATAWKYYNVALGHVVSTRGMAPRPFVYPALLRLRSAFVNSLKEVCKYGYKIKWNAGTYPDHRGARGANEGKGGRHGLG